MSEGVQLGVHVKCLLLLFDFKQSKVNRLQQNFPISNFISVCKGALVLLRAYRWKVKT